MTERNVLRDGVPLSRPEPGDPPHVKFRFKPRPLFGNYSRIGFEDQIVGPWWVEVCGTRYWRSMNRATGFVRVWLDEGRSQIAESAPDVRRVLMCLASRHGVAVSAIVENPRYAEEQKKCRTTGKAVK